MYCKLTQDNAIGLCRRLPDEPDWRGPDFWEKDADWRAWYYHTKNDQSGTCDINPGITNGWRIYIHLKIQLLSNIIIHETLSITCFLIQKVKQKKTHFKRESSWYRLINLSTVENTISKITTLHRLVRCMFQNRRTLCTSVPWSRCTGERQIKS